MKAWLLGLLGAGALAIGSGTWLAASGRDLVLERPSGGAFVLSAWLIGSGIALLFATVLLAVFTLPVLATLRHVRGVHEADQGFSFVAQKTQELERVAKVLAPGVKLPTYLVVFVGASAVEVWARASGSPMRVGRESILDISTGFAVTSRRVPAVEVFVNDPNLSSFSFAPSRPNAVLFPILDSAKVEALVQSIRRTIVG